jgi:hypothetical protein
MSRTIQTRFKSSLPGSGFDSAGSAKQGKRRVVGAISVTSYAAVGESLTPNDIGLSNIDYISLKHTDESSGPNGQGGRFVRYQTSTADFYIVQEAGVTGKTDIATGTTHALRFDAIGDSADDVELT